MQVPSSAEQCTRLAADFYNRWNLPNCIGAIDEKHIQIKAPDQESKYFNYMGFHGIILLALADAYYCITYFDVGTNEKAGDASVFRESALGKRLERTDLAIPGPYLLAMTLYHSLLLEMMLSPRSHIFLSHILY